MHKIYDYESTPKLLICEEDSLKTGNKGCTLKWFTGTHRINLNIGKNSSPRRVAEQWNSLQKSVLLTKSINSFKNYLDNLWSNQAILYDYEAPLPLTVGTRIS